MDRQTVVQVNEAARGPRGYSAYQIAVTNGFVGTEAEWLDSLHGTPPDGDYGDIVVSSPGGNKALNIDPAVLSTFGRLMAGTATRGDAVELLELDTRFTITPTNPLFGGEHYDSADPVDAADALNAFFTHAEDTNNARRYVYDWHGEWYTLKPVYSLNTSSDPDARRRFICGTLRVGPKAELPGGVAMFAALTMASYHSVWEGAINVQEAGAHPHSGNTTYATRRYRHGVHITQFALSSIDNPIVVDNSIRDGVLFEGWEAGTNQNLGGEALPGQNSIGSRIAGVIGRNIGACQHFDPAQGPAPLILTGLTHGRTQAGAPFTNTEGFTAGSAGWEQNDAQRSQLTIGGGSTTADMEINDQVFGRVELLPAFYGTVQAIPDADPTTGKFRLTAGDPTNIDGAGHGLSVGDILIPQGGENDGKQFIITGFGGVSNRDISVTRKDIYNTTLNMTAHAASAADQYKMFTPFSVHWVTRVNSANTFTVTPWWPYKINSQIRLYHGAGLRMIGNDLANISVGSVIVNIGAYSFYASGNFMPTVQTMLGQTCASALRLGDMSYGAGLGLRINHGHSEGNIFDLITGGGFAGYVNLSSYNNRNFLSYTPRNGTNDMAPVNPRGIGAAATLDLGEVCYTPEYGGRRDDPSGQNFISNGRFYRRLFTEGLTNPIEVRYDDFEADTFVKNHWAEVFVSSTVGGSIGNTISFPLSKRMVAEGWTYSSHAGGGTTYTAPISGMAYALRFIYKASQKRVGVQRIVEALDYLDDLRSPGSLYVGEYTPGAGYVDGKEIVLRNSTGYGFRAAMNGATNALYIQSIKPFTGYGYMVLEGLTIDLNANGTLTGTIDTTGFNLANGKHLKIAGTAIVDGSTKLLQAVAVPAFAGGDVTSPGASLVLTIGANKVTRGMLSQAAGATLLGATGAGNVTDLTAAQAKTFLAIAAADISGLSAFATSTDLVNATGTLDVARTPALSGGDVTKSAGSGTLTIGANKVTRGMLAQAAGATILGATGAGNVTDLTAAQAKTFLAIAAADVSGLSAFATGTDAANLTGTVAAARIATNSLALTKLAQTAGATLLGSTAAGNVTEMTAAQAKTFLAIAESDVTGLTTDLNAKAPKANPQFTGTAFFAQGAPTAKNATATLTIAEILTLIITSTSTTAVSLTLPTGTLTDAGILSGALPTDMAFEWYTINLGSSSGAVTLVAGTGHTIVGNAVVAIGTTARWLTRKTATNTFVTYRIA